MSLNFKNINIDFEIEIVDAYDITPAIILKVPKEELSNKASKRIGWSIHVYIAVLDIDIRGVVAKKIKNDWFIVMPYNVNFDKESQKMVRFPSITFTNPDKQSELLKQIKEKFSLFIKEKLVEEIEEKEKKKIAWLERNKKNDEKALKMSDKRNEKEKYNTQFKTKAQVKK